MQVLYIILNIIIIQLIVRFMRIWLTAGMGQAGYILDNYIFFHGVVVHELSHMIAAIVTGAKIIKFDLFKVDREKHSLGSVQVRMSRNKFIAYIQSFFISTAPLYMSCIIAIFLSKILLSPWYNGEVNILEMLNLPQFWLFIIIIVPILAHADLSPEDIKVGLPGLIFISIMLFIISFIFPGVPQVILNAAIFLRNTTIILMLIPFVLGLIAKFMI